MPMATLDGVDIHYRLSGPADAPVIVFSNSLGADLRMWDAQAAHFEGQYRILRYDTRGHGSSSVPDGLYSLDPLGNDLLRLLDHLHIERTVACGISLGGMTALWLAANAPQRVLGLVAANTAARIGSAEAWSARMEQVRQHGMASLIDATVPRWFTARYLAVHPEAAAYTARVLAATPAAGYIGCCAALRDADLTAQLGSIQAPALVVAGLSDTATPPSDAAFLQQHIAGSTRVELEAAHISNIEAADSFNAAVDSLLQRIPTFT